MSNTKLFDSVLFAFGVKHVGEIVAKKLALHFSPWSVCIVVATRIRCTFIQYHYTKGLVSIDDFVTEHHQMNKTRNNCFKLKQCYTASLSGESMQARI